MIFVVFVSLTVFAYGAPQSKNVPKQITQEEIAKILPVMKALLKVVKTNRPTPEDMNSLFVFARDLQKLVPDTNTQFGVSVNFEDLGIPETGDIIESIDGEAFILTKFGECMLPLKSNCHF